MTALTMIEQIDGPFKFAVPDLGAEHHGVIRIDNDVLVGCSCGWAVDLGDANLGQVVDAWVAHA